MAVNRVVRLDDAVLAYSCVWELREELKINNIAVRADLRTIRWLRRISAGSFCHDQNTVTHGIQFFRRKAVAQLLQERIHRFVAAGYVLAVVPVVTVRRACLKNGQSGLATCLLERRARALGRHDAHSGLAGVRTHRTVGVGARGDEKRVQKAEDR